MERSNIGLLGNNLPWKKRGILGIVYIIEVYLHLTPTLIKRIYHNKIQRGEIVHALENNLLPNHRQINTCTAIELDPKPIIVEESRDCIENLTKEAEVVDSLMKTKEFKNLFEALEFNEQAQKEALATILEISKRF